MNIFRTDQQVDSMDARKLSSMYIPLWGIFIFGLLTILYFVQAVFIPIFLAVLTSFLLNPVAFISHKLWIPRPIGAGLVLVSLSLAVGFTFNSLAEPAGMWFERLPSELRQTETKLAVLRKSIKNVQETTKSFGKIAVPDNNVSDTPVLAVRGPNLFFRILDSTQSFIIGLTSYFVLLYLLLAFSKSLGRDAGTLLMNKSYYKAMLTIARQAQARISYYLLVITIINIVLGCAVTLATWSTGLPNPMVWGASAALLNNIPYVVPERKPTFLRQAM